jgi:PTH1 family peptidyl-tRNA hydrolase
MDDSILIVGLGNPGNQYATTRHNAGFMMVEALAARWKVNWSEERTWNLSLAKFVIDGKKIFLCRPLTFMNCSGEAVGPLAKFYKIAPERVVASVDDADLNFGTLRMRVGGSSGGHHGLDSLQEHLGTQDFPRQRIGIGRKDGSSRQIAGYVLGQFDSGERQVLPRILGQACDQIECGIREGLEKAMNKFNGAITLQ